MTENIMCNFCHDKSNIKQPILMLIADGKSPKYMDSFEINPVNNRLELKNRSYISGYTIKFCPVCSKELG